jgi:hypothetical protein
MFRVRPSRALLTLLLVTGAVMAPASWTGIGAQADLSASGKQLYDQVKAFKLTGGSAEVTGLALRRDRVEMTFTGTLYFGAAAGDTVTGAVFIGQGAMRAEAPPTDFERENVQRLLKAELVDSDFKTAVLRFSDDTFAKLSLTRKDGGTAPAQAQKLADETEARLLQNTGVNVPARLATSMLNHDTPGVFFAEFDGGRRGRFDYVLDQQGRIPTADPFGLDGGEKGLIFQYNPSPVYFSEVWMAFYAEDDYAKKTVSYSDANDAIDIKAYRLNLDVRGVPLLGMTGTIDFTVRKAGTRAVTFKIGESLTEREKQRLVNQLRVKHIRLGDQELAWVQEDWEGGFTAFLPKAAQAGDAVSLGIDLQGAYFQIQPYFEGCFYLFDNFFWIPRHGYLDRATFDLTFRYRKRDRVSSGGTRVSDDPDPQDPQGMVAHYVLNHPVALATFAVGPWERKSKQTTFENGGPTIPVEFNSVPQRVLSKTTLVAVNDDLILGEMDNAVRYFANIFGPYPYESFSGTFTPFNFGQSAATMLMIPPATSGRESNVYQFFSHETAHQWWGHVVLWKSYRDQWLSEGFAEYSSTLYAAKRTTDANKTVGELVQGMRQSLLGMPGTLGGVGKGRLNDIGPIVLGRRLQTLKTLGAYQALIYSKGALVLRMLQFLLSNPSTGDNAEFLATMKDFTTQYREASASTEDFWKVANLHFARTPIAGKFGLQNLDWFFKEWVYGTGLPTYQMQYETVAQPDGSLMLKGTIAQTNVDADFQMVLPLVMTFEGNQEARTSVRALGPTSTFELKVPQKPKKVELDPFNWVLSEKTTSRAK